MLERLVTYRHSSLLVLFEIYEEDKVKINQHYTCQLLCCIRTKNYFENDAIFMLNKLGQYSQRFIFFIISEWAL